MALVQGQAQVVMLDSLDEDIFICGICKSVFNSLQLYLDHKNIQCCKEIVKNNKNLGTIHTKLEDQSSSSSVSCDKKCNKGLQNRHPVTATRGELKDITCMICNKIFKKLKFLHAHLKLHERPVQCLVCGRCFESNSHLKRHTQTHRVWPEGINETTPKTLDVELLSYSCLYCHSVLANYSQFRAHLNNHLALKKFKCIQGECNCFFENIDDLLCHVPEVHDIAQYTCHICKKQFNSLEEIANHHQSQNKGAGEHEKSTQIGKFKCLQCDATFSRQEKLSLHILTENHHKTCIHCSKTFASDKRLRMHLQIHKKTKPYECNICGTSFQIKKYLSSHLLKHGESRFTCVICKQTFKRQDVLQRHMKLHLLRKFFKCPFKDITGCTKEFSRCDKLKEHLKSHTGKKSSQEKILSSIDSASNTMEICIVPLEGLNFNNTLINKL